MNQNQCVPSWEVEDVTPIPHVPPPPPLSRVVTSRSHSSGGCGPDISLQDYEVTELTWENGQLMMHGLGLPRVPSKSNLANGTLESIVNQATKNDDNMVPLFDGGHGPPNSAPASVSMSMDALVPTTVGCSTRVGSCSVALARVPAAGSDWSESLSGSAWRRGDTCQHMSGGVNGMTSTSFGLSLDNTKTVVTGGDDHDSVCHSRPKKARSRGEEEEDNEKKGTCKSSGNSAKRSRAAAIHNQSERKRRDKINQRMKTLQKMVPSSSKTDKSSMLDEVIDYLKQLQAQVQMMSRMSMAPSMMMTMPMAIQQQQLQMSMMSQMGMGMGMGMMGMGMGMPGMGMGIDPMTTNINAAASITRPTNVPGLSAAVVNPSAFMPRVTCDGVSGAPSVGDRVSSYQPTMVPSDPFSAYLTSQQSQPMTMDAYSRMATMYQQLQQHQQQQFGPSNSYYI